MQMCTSLQILFNLLTGLILRLDRDGEYEPKFIGSLLIAMNTLLLCRSYATFSIQTNVSKEADDKQVKTIALTSIKIVMSRHKIVDNDTVDKQLGKHLVKTPSDRFL